MSVTLQPVLEATVRRHATIERSFKPAHDPAPSAEYGSNSLFGFEKVGDDYCVIILENNNLEFRMSSNKQETVILHLFIETPNFIAPYSDDSGHIYCYVANEHNVYLFPYQETDKCKDGVFYLSKQRITSLSITKSSLFVGTESGKLIVLSHDNYSGPQVINYNSFSLFNPFSTQAIVEIYPDNPRFVLLSTGKLVAGTAKKRIIDLNIAVNQYISFKAGKINDKYVAAISSGRKIIVVSVSEDLSDIRVMDPIITNSLLSFAISYNSILVLERDAISDPNEKNGFLEFARLFVYRNFETEPSSVWDILNEFNFIVQVKGKPSERETEIHDRLNTLSKIFGYSSNTISKSEFLMQCSPFIFIENHEHLLCAFTGSVLYHFDTIPEELSVFRSFAINFDLALNANEEETQNKENTHRKYFGKIAKEVYDHLPAYYFSYIDSSIIHRKISVVELLSEVALSFANEYPTITKEIAALVTNKYRSISHCLKYLMIQKEGDSQQCECEFMRKFWYSSTLLQSYQLFKFTSSILIGLYLVKHTIQLNSKSDLKIEGLSQIISKVERITESYASIYQICSSENIKFKLYSTSSPIDFQKELSDKFYYLLNNIDYLIQNAQDNKNIEDINIYLSKVTNSHQ